MLEKSWNTIQKRGWFRYVILRYALAYGLTMGIGIPLLNNIILPAPDYNLMEKLAFSVPFFVTSWGAYGAYSWNGREKRRHQLSQNDF